MQCETTALYHSSDTSTPQNRLVHTEKHAGKWREKKVSWNLKFTLGILKTKELNTLKDILHPQPNLKLFNWFSQIS